MSKLAQVNLDKPRWDQNTYWGRARYFFNTTNPINLLATPAQLDEAKRIVDHYKKGIELPGKSLDDVWKAKDLVDSAFHPQTGEKMIIFGRMSAQVPMNVLITGAMLTFYKSTPAVVFWQWFNQSFNAVVNYTNRSGGGPVDESLLIKSYCAATGSAVATAMSLNHLAKKAPPIFARLVPFTAVAAANMVNIPFMRNKEITDGLPVFDANNNLIGNSQKAAITGIAMVVVSRIGMATPGMIGIPVILNYLEKKETIRNIKWAPSAIQMGLLTVFLTFTTPMCCALFPQQTPIAVSSLEPELQERAKKLTPMPTVGYYNKGL